LRLGSQDDLQDYGFNLSEAGSQTINSFAFTSTSVGRCSNTEGFSALAQLHSASHFESKSLYWKSGLESRWAVLFELPRFDIILRCMRQHRLAALNLYRYNSIPVG
jgi:hypothetical protein